jgi:hypothetical protein
MLYVSAMGAVLYADTPWRTMTASSGAKLDLFAHYYIKKMATL